MKEKQLNDMKHAIGYDARKVDENNVYNAYRNHFALGKDSPEWDELVSNGYATKRTVFEDVVYHLTDKGIAYLEGVLSIKIIRT